MAVHLHLLLLLLLLLDELRYLLLLLRDDRLECREGFAKVDLFSYYWWLRLLLLPKYWGALWRRFGLLCFCG